MDDHMMRFLAGERLAELEAVRRRQAAIREFRAGRPGLRVRAGLALIRAGRWLAGQVPALPDTGAVALGRARSGSR